jgi:hypothetical protein
MMADAMKVWAMMGFSPALLTALEAGQPALASHNGGEAGVSRSTFRAAGIIGSGHWRLPALTLGMALSLVASSTAWGQMGGGGPMGAVGHPTSRQSNSAEKPALPAPDAVPGAKPREPAAPATRAATDMQPTDALFDAINRGDIAAARDSLNRGADLNGVNVLGMTPMELSVDLGRNDISFLLLSMRGEDSGRGSRAVGRDVAAPARRADQAAKPAAPVKSTPAGKRTVAAKPVAAPKLFANDGGRPLPNAGFLGFDSRSAAD